MNASRHHSSCIQCGNVLHGRVDQRFCDAGCRSAWHYEKSKEQTPAFYQEVAAQLRLNRRILKAYNKAGKSTVRANKLLEAGFNPAFFTHFWRGKKGGTYLFCYEHGFQIRLDKGVEKYVLITWQDYMKPQKPATAAS